MREVAGARGARRSRRPRTTPRPPGCRRRVASAGRCRRSRPSAATGCLRAAGSPTTAARRSGCCDPAREGRRRRSATVSCGPATPMTRNHCSLTFTYWPIGSSAPNSFAARASPSTRDRRARRRLRARRRTGRDTSARSGDVLVARLDAEDQRRLALRLGHQLRRREPLARRRRGDAVARWPGSRGSRWKVRPADSLRTFWSAC